MTLHESISKLWLSFLSLIFWCIVCRSYLKEITFKLSALTLRNKSTYRHSQILFLCPILTKLSLHDYTVICKFILKASNLLNSKVVEATEFRTLKGKSILKRLW